MKKAIREYAEKLIREYGDAAYQKAQEAAPQCSQAAQCSLATLFGTGRDRDCQARSC
jgi:hypothetical protein